MACGNSFRNAVSLLRPSPVAAHLGVEPSFIHKHPPPVFDLPYDLLKYLALLPDGLGVLFLGIDRLFLRRSPIFFFSTTQIEGRLTRSWALWSSFSCSSTRV